MGSDLAEVQNVVDVSFPKMSEQVNAFAKNSITQFGLSEKMAKQFMGTYGAMSKSFGFSEEAAYEMSKTVTGLVGDVASFYNISQDLASVKLKAIWTGETEGLKDLGVVMTQTALNEYAMQQGLGKTVDKMSEAEKVALRYSFVQNKLSGAMGDFARTSDGWANQTRILSLQFNQLKATLGQGFITLFTPIIKGINTILAGLQKVAEVFTSVISKIFGKQSETISNVTTDYVGMGESATESANETVDASKKAQKAIMGYDKLNILSNKKDSGSGSEGSSAPIVGGSGISTPKVEDNTSPMVDLIANKIVNILEKVKSAFLVCSDFIKKHWDTIVALLVSGAVTIGVALAGIKIAKFINSISEIISNVSKAGGILNFLATMIGGLSAPVLTAIGIIALLAGGFTFLYLTCDSFKESINRIISAFGESLTPAMEFITNTVLPDLQNGFNGFIEIMQPFVDFVSGIFTDIWQKILEPALMYIAQTVIPTLTQTFDNLWNNVLVPFGTFIGDVLEPIVKILTEAFQILWDNVLLPLADFIGGIFSKAFEGISEIFNKTVIPVVQGVINVFSWLWNNILAPIVNFLWQNLKPAFETVTKTIGDLLGSVKTIFGGIIDFITGVFTGNWEKAWNGIKDIFKGIIDGLANIFKTPINLIIDGINIFLRALNKIKIPDWVPVVGGAGFDIPEIPKLAEGAWFKARNPRLAIVGEGKENEIVAPESKIEDAVEKGNQKNNNQGTTRFEFVIHVEYEDGRRIIKKINDTQIKDGKISLIV